MNAGYLTMALETQNALSVRYEANTFAWTVVLVMGTANTFGTIGAVVGPSMSGPASAADTVTPKAAAIATALTMLFRCINLKPPFLKTSFFAQLSPNICD